MMHPVRAILLDHDLERLLRAHKVTARELAQLLSPSAPPRKRGGCSPARAAKIECRDALLQQLRDRLDPEHQWTVAKLHTAMARLWRQREAIIEGEEVDDAVLAEASVADLLFRLSELKMPNVILSRNRLSKILNR
ncbi:hypothetical protein B6V73_00070 [Thioclava sp. JM3]|uniref:hypothetical protein n=1 Tax=Thioclava sp. JM3 TaxID=1973004 RepID=UPI000B5473E0|nr:hypothetical protein [Thioclava sp. JM3]OWY18251.1 hypothetical protein B6V73_00070 [Thioclava sp. JM3]